LTKQFKKGLFTDGHEREDVREYRDCRFLPFVEVLQLCMLTYEV
jgi:hypothetical protein